MKTKTKIQGNISACARVSVSVSLFVRGREGGYAYITIPSLGTISALNAINPHNVTSSIYLNIVVL